jgi:hypothetical protein
MGMRMFEVKVGHRDEASEFHPGEVVFEFLVEHEDAETVRKVTEQMVDSRLWRVLSVSEEWR